MDSDTEWSEWSDTDLKEMSEKIDQEMSTPKDNGNDQQDYGTPLNSTTVSTNPQDQTFCERNITAPIIDGAPSISSNDSDPEDSVPLIHVTKNKMRLQKQDIKGKEMKRLSTVKRARHLKSMSVKVNDDVDDSIPLINVTRNK